MGYERQTKTALNLIAKKGTPATFKKVEKIKDIAQPWKQDVTATLEYSVNVSLLPFKRIGKETQGSMKDSEVPRGSVKALMGNNSFEPAVQDLIIVGAMSYSILNIETIAPSGVPILYEMELG